MLKRYLNIITKVSSLVMVFFIFINCQQNSIFKASNPSIKFRYEIQSIKNDGHILVLNDSINVYFHDHYIVYQWPYAKTYFKGTMDKDYNEIDNKLVRVDTGYYYIIYKEKNRWCYQFDSLSFKKSQRMSIDSFQTNTLWKNYPFYQKKVDSLIDAKTSKDKKVLIEKYICRHKKDDTYTDTMYYYFDQRLVNVNFSLSPEMDSIKHSKLFKIRYIFNKVPKGQKYFGKVRAFDIPKKEWLFEISENKVGESPALTHFINLFKSKEKELYNGN